uniref:Uncharacterized protein n=1 Tax=Onchocerca volvulus TaxID=6282 RepID=A0A2K6WLL9_ONCVO
MKSAFFMSPLLFCILNTLILLAASHDDVQDINRNILNDEHIMQSRFVIFNSTSWNETSPEDQRMLSRLLDAGYITPELLPWISGRRLVIRINTNYVGATDGLNYSSVDVIRERQ